MLDQVLEAFDIVPDIDLNLMETNQTLAGLTSKAINALNQFIEKEQPDLVLLQGDTTTVFCAALAALYNHVPIGHIEAGLRTGNLYSPWPEEANRILTSRLASLHFAPTEMNVQNLLREGIPRENIFITGNTVIDALFISLEKIKSNPPKIPGIGNNLFIKSIDTPLVLITGHRRENFGPGFESICQAIAELASMFPETQFVYPVHLNPNVRGPVFNILGSIMNIKLLEPLNYMSFVALMNRATLILTDSGGIQEEAPSLGKPVLIMRDTTERPEAIYAGTAKLVGATKKNIIENVSTLLTDEKAYLAMTNTMNPYGDGNASHRILDLCKHFLDVNSKMI